jgi:hypothetical protein
MTDQLKTRQLLAADLGAGSHVPRRARVAEVVGVISAGVMTFLWSGDARLAASATRLLITDGRSPSTRARFAAGVRRQRQQPR